MENTEIQRNSTTYLMSGEYLNRNLENKINLMDGETELGNQVLDLVNIYNNLPLKEGAYVSLSNECETLFNKVYAAKSSILSPKQKQIQMEVLCGLIDRITTDYLKNNRQ